MAVPSSNSHVRNTTGGAFTSQTQGGTIINNDNTGDVITKSFQLNAAVADTTDASTLPSVSGGGGGNTFKPLSGGTFGYAAEGKYVIARSSSTLSGVSNTKLLFMGAGDKLPIARFRGDFGAKLLTAWRNNQFSWLHKLDSGAAITNMRINWLNAAGNAAAPPVKLNGTYMWDPVADSVSQNSDSAANPTRAVPGEFVMKVDFVTVSIDDAGAGDFFNYAPITGM
jgi:hypothetical protein